MTEISFIYFDVGGVMIQDFSDSGKWGEMKRVMGIPLDRDKEFDLYYKTKEWDVNLGRPVDDLIPEIESEFGIKLQDNFSMQQYFIDHFEPNLSLWPEVDYVRSKYKVGLLTNIYPRMLDEIREKGILPPIEWDIVIDSSIEKVRKPMSEIYQLSTKKAKVPPSEILLIDNTQKNLDSALTSGWQTYFYDSRDYDKSSQELTQFLGNLP